MLYKNSSVLRPKKTKIQPRNGSKYVYVVTGKTYHKEKKFYTETRKCVGVMIDDQHMMVNEYFKVYFPDEVVTYSSHLQYSKVVKVGATAVLKKIFEDLNIAKHLRMAFEDTGDIDFDLPNTVFNLASYMILEEKSAFQYFEHFRKNHYLMDSTITNDVDICNYLKEKLSNKAKILDFNRSWFKDNVNNNHIYLSIDGTNVNNVSEGVTLKEYGHAKDNDDEPIVNLTYAFNQTNYRPLAYDIYKGSITDMAQINGFLKKISDFGLEKVSLILDRGYFSRKNIDAIMRKCAGFIMMVKDSNTIIKEKINEVLPIIASMKYHIEEHDVYGITIYDKLFKQDSDAEKRYFHIYLDKKRQDVQSKKLLQNLKQQLLLRQKEIGNIYNESYNNDYFEYQLDNNIIKDVSLNYDTIDEACERYGFFCIISSSQMTAEEALTTYRNRDEIEKIYRTLKSQLGLNSFYVQSNESLRGKAFIAFIATILRNELLQRLKQYKKKDHKNYTVPAALYELDDIESLYNSKGEYILDTELTLKQKNILEANGIKTSYFDEINKELTDLVIQK